MDEVVDGQGGIEDIYRLSPLQQGLLFRTLSLPQSGECFIQTTWSLQGDLSIQALKRACEEIINRHGILRSGFIVEGVREAVQVVYEQARMTWAEQDWRGLSEAAQAERLEAYLR